MSEAQGSSAGAAATANAVDQSANLGAAEGTSGQPGPESMDVLSQSAASGADVTTEAGSSLLPGGAGGAPGQGGSLSVGDATSNGGDSSSASSSASTGGAAVDVVVESAGGGGAGQGDGTPTLGGAGGLPVTLETAGAGGAAEQAEAGAPGAPGMGNDDCASGALVCDGFENYMAGSAPGEPWTATTRGSGAVVVDTTRAFSGEQSLHVTGQLNADHAYIITPVEDTEVAHVRFMMYTVSYPASSGVHSRLALLGLSNLASGSPETSYSLATYNGTAIERVNSIYLRDTGTHMDDSNLTNRWVCWEFGVDKTGGVGNVEVHIWVDGRDLPLSPAGSASHGMTVDSWDPVVFESFMLGLYGYQADSQRADYWIDDVSVTPERVGCPEQN